MRKVVLIITVSIDGYVEAPSGRAVGATAEPAELKRWKLDRIRNAGTHIMGRVTYEGMAATWPTSHDAYAAPMNDIPKVVFSSTLDVADWHRSTIARGDLADEIAALRKQPGGEIITWGGARFAQSLSRARLIDEYAIITRPVAYGSGEPLFRDLGETLELDVLTSINYAGERRSTCTSLDASRMMRAVRAASAIISKTEGLRVWTACSCALLGIASDQKG